MHAFIFYTSLAYLVFHFSRNRFIRVLIILSSSLLILMIGISRIYLGVHYPTDIIAGYIAGFWWFVTVIVVNKTLQFVKNREENDPEVKLRILSLFHQLLNAYLFA